MKAARFYDVGQPLVVEDVPKPRPESGEVLIGVRACGICGSDIHIAYEGVTPTAFQPIVLGHEFSGEIVGLGEGVEGWQVGDRVAVCCIVSCGQCMSCLSGNQEICLQRRLLGIHLNGGLAEYATVPARNLAKLHDNIPFEEGAVLTDAVAAPYHALTRRGRLVPGETVAVIGCGGLGIHGVQLSRICGAGIIIAVDVSDRALERAMGRGADLLCNGSREDPLDYIRNATGGLGVDLALEFVGQKETISLSVACLKVGGRAAVVGLGPERIETLPPTEFVRRQVELRGSYGFTVREIEELIQLMAGGRLDISQSVTKKMPLDQINEGMEALHKKVDDPIRIVFTP